MFEVLASPRALSGVVMLAVQALEAALASDAPAADESATAPESLASAHTAMAGKASHVLLILLGGETTPRPAMLRYETSRKQAEAQYRAAARDRRRRAAGAQSTAAADGASSPISMEPGDGADAGAGGGEAALAERAATAAAAAVPSPHSQRSVLTHRAVHTVCSTATAVLGDGASPAAGPPTDPGPRTLICRICHACASHATRAAPRARASDPVASVLLMNTGALLSLLLYSSRVPAGPQAAGRRFIADDGGVGGALRRVMHDLTLWWERGCHRAASLGASCLGRAVWVHWPADGTWYRGRVIHFSPSSLHHTVRYAQDASCERLVLGRVRHAVLPHAPSGDVADLVAAEENTHVFRTVTQPPVVAALLEPSRRASSVVDVEASWLGDSAAATPPWLWRADSATGACRSTGEGTLRPHPLTHTHTRTQTERQWVRPLLDTLLLPRAEALSTVDTDSAQLSRVVEQLNTSPWLPSRGEWTTPCHPNASPSPSPSTSSPTPSDAPDPTALSGGLEELAGVLVKLCGEAADTGVPRELLKGRRGARGRPSARARRSPARTRRARSRPGSRFGAMPGEIDDHVGPGGRVHVPQGVIVGARRLQHAATSPFAQPGHGWAPPHIQSPGMCQSGQFVRASERPSRPRPPPSPS